MFSSSLENVSTFIPASLSSLADPPRFSLRQGSRRLRSTYDRLLITEGLQFHSAAAFRAEILRGLEATQPAGLFAEQKARLTALWATVDAHEAKTADMETPPPLAHEDMADCDELARSLSRDWERLREMAADNVVFQDQAPFLMLATLLQGWRGLDVRFRKADGVVVLDVLEQLPGALSRLEQANAGVEGVSPGLAYAELLAEAALRLFSGKAD